MSVGGDEIGDDVSLKESVKRYIDKDGGIDNEGIEHRI